ncbi:MAG: coproporphyrinogen III oxidase [Rickettsiaceae bacterium]|nr:coproporphyrinogen III oxidase [Rickettsiaceae bacterium]
MLLLIVSNNMSKPILIYLHWPFCLSLCPYCDFNSHLAAKIDQDKWLQAYLKEINFFIDKIKNKKVKSIFFGGGTPSLMNPKIVAAIIDYIAKIATIDDNTEITLEANPTSSEVDKFIEFRNAGINRVSIGIQALNDRDLQKLGRKHNSKEAINAINLASNIFPRFSFDLIYARPQQTMQEWQQELTLAINDLPLKGHISLYQLTIEKGTEFYKLYNNKQLTLPENDLAANMYEWTNNYLIANGYERYEISNYAIKGEECKHNLGYWHYEEYIGIGPGAHSRLHLKNKILANMMIHKPDKWLDQVLTKGDGIQQQVKLSTKEIIEEIIMMGMRLSSGISDHNLQQLLNLKFSDVLKQDTLQEYINLGLIKDNKDKLCLTDKGLLLHSYIVPRLC